MTYSVLKVPLNPNQPTNHELEFVRAKEVRPIYRKGRNSMGENLRNLKSNVHCIVDCKQVDNS